MDPGHTEAEVMGYALFFLWLVSEEPL